MTKWGCPSDRYFYFQTAQTNGINYRTHSITFNILFTSVIAYFFHTKTITWQISTFIDEHQVYK